MKIKDIIKEKYKVARKYYETYKHTTECSYYMGYLDALGELLERIEQEEEKKIPEKLNWNKNDFTYPEGNLMSEETADMLMEIQDKVNFILNYLKSKGE